MRTLVLALAICLAFVHVSDGARAIFFFHGMMNSGSSFDRVIAAVQRVRPEATLFSLPIFESVDGITPLRDQIIAMKATIRSLMEFANISEYDLVCHSQGGLTCRSFIEFYPDHGVNTFVSLSGVQMGVYQSITDSEKFFFHLPQNVTKETAYQYIYTFEYQNTLSVAGYWHDPYHRADMINAFTFLTQWNGLMPGYPMDTAKTNFLKLKRAIFFGGPDDGTIAPWETTLFGFYNSAGAMVPMTEQVEYTSDTFGLKSLHQRGDLKLVNISGVDHGAWYNPDVFMKYVYPYLSV